MRPWLERGYAIFSMTDRGCRESCGSQASRDADPARLRQRLHPPDRQPLRGRATPRSSRAARRRGPDRPAAHRRDRRLVRRRHVDGARRLQGPQDAARRQPRPLDEPRRQADADRGRGADMARGPTSPTRWCRTAARSTTSPTRPTDGRAIGVDEAVLRQRPLRDRAKHRATTRRRDRPRRRPDGWQRADQRRRALRREPDGAGRWSTRSPQHHSSYYIDHSEPPAPLLIQNGFTDDLFPADEAIRFYNRTRTQYPEPTDLAVLRRHRAPRAQNKSRRPGRPRARRERLDRPLRQGRRRRARRRASTR